MNIKDKRKSPLRTGILTKIEDITPNWGDVEDIDRALHGGEEGNG